MYIVSGASRGIGKFIFESLKSQKKNVIGLARKADPDKDIIECDVSNFESIKSAHEIIKKRHKKIYALINVAGIASMNLAIAMPEDITRKIINTNLLGTIFLNQLFSTLLIRNNNGRIINFSTVAVNLAIKGESVYTASKAGIESYSRTLAKELSSFNITVNCIAPGPIKTDLTAGVTDKQLEKIINQQIIQKQLHPSDVMDQVDLLLSEKAKYITGEVIVVGGV